MFDLSQLRDLVGKKSHYLIFSLQGDTSRCSFAFVISGLKSSLVNGLSWQNPKDGVGLVFNFGHCPVILQIMTFRGQRDLENRGYEVHL